MRRLFSALLTVAAICVLAAGVAFAGQEKGQQEVQAPQQLQVSAEEMAAWQTAATPGPHHKRFAEMVGSWKAEVKMWMAPGAEPMVSETTAKCETLYDGRYCVEKIEGMMMGMPFQGMSISGYDNLKGKHTVVWIDNMGTGTIYSEGDCSEDCTVGTYRYVYKDAMTGKDQKVKMVSRLVDKNKMILESYMIGEDGKEFRNMEITYTRM